MQILNVAKFYEMDPGVVIKWPFIDFDDREEYMFLMLGLYNTTDNDGQEKLDSDREEWRPEGQ